MADVPLHDLPDHLVPESDLPGGSGGEPTLGDKAGAVAYGAATSAMGGLGELERFGAHTVPNWLGAKEAAPWFFGKPGEKEGTLLPDVKDAESFLRKFGIQPPKENVSGYRTAGDIIGGIGPAIPSMARGAIRGVLGKPSATSEAAAKGAEALGFKLSPAQVRRTAPTGQRGATGWGEHNQDLANKLVSRGTGVEASAVTPEYIRSRLKDLGGQFDAIYKGKSFRVDQKAMDAVEKILEAERAHVTGTEVTPVERAAKDIVDAWNKLRGPTSTSREIGAATGGSAPQFFIDGEALQRLRNVLTEKARATGSATTAHEIYDLVSEIDASVARNHPGLAAKLDALRPKYRNSLVLEDLYQRGGIKNGDVSLERLGNIMKGGDSSVRLPGREIDQLARTGRDTYMRALWEPEGQIGSEGVNTLSEALKTKLGVIPKSLGLQSRPARAMQRAVAGSTKPMDGTAALTAAGTAVRPLQPEQEQ